MAEAAAAISTGNVAIITGFSSVRLEEPVPAVSDYYSGNTDRRHSLLVCAVEARLHSAFGAAYLVSVVTLLAGFNNSVPAHLVLSDCFLALGSLSKISTASIVPLNKAVLRTAISVDSIAVITGLSNLNDAVAARWIFPGAKRTGSSTVEPHIDFASVRTTRTILIIALLSWFNHTVTTEAAKRSRTNRSGALVASVKKTVCRATSSISVIALLPFVNYAIPADWALEAKGTAAGVAIAGIALNDEAALAPWVVTIVTLLAFFQDGVATHLTCRSEVRHTWVHAVGVTRCLQGDREWDWFACKWKTRRVQRQCLC